MNIIKYEYRKPDYLTPIDCEKFNAIAVHHTGNDNPLKVNTDYHVDVNGWNWLGYNFYIMEGDIYEVRGIHHQPAGVRHHNNHIISIAVQGNYDSKLPSQRDIEALQWLVSYLKTTLPNITELDGHKRWNDTSCPGRLFPLKSIRLEPLQSDSVDIVDKLEEKVKDLDSKVTRILRYLDGQGVRIR